MIRVAKVCEIRDIEAATDRSLMSYRQMMQRAGESACRHLQRRFDITEATKITFLIGKGNNGGDGLVMARELARQTPAEIRLYLLEARGEDDRNFQAILQERTSLSHADEDISFESLRSMIESADVIVDALFGIGFRPPSRDKAASILRAVNDCLKHREAEAEAIEVIDVSATRAIERSTPYVLAIDCPSGIDCDTGKADSNTIAADETITFIAAKPGLFTFPAANYVGNLFVATLGIPDTFPSLKRILTSVVDARTAASLLPRRPVDGHKGTFGKVMLVGGSANYVGAISLAAEAAGRSGAGLVAIASSGKLVEIAASRLPEPIWLPLPDDQGAIAESAAAQVKQRAKDYDALLVGCGLGLHESTRDFFARLLHCDHFPPLTLDADALRFLANTPQWWELVPEGSVVTPHSGEMARLTNSTASEVNAARWEFAQKYAEMWNLVVVLKGAHTIIAAPDGRACVIPFKTDALATAGTGDILAGLIAGMRAQGMAAYDSARLGAYIHALAGIMAAKTVGSSRSVIAGDVLGVLGKAFERIESR